MLFRLPSKAYVAFEFVIALCFMMCVLTLETLRGSIRPLRLGDLRCWSPFRAVSLRLEHWTWNPEPSVLSFRIRFERNILLLRAKKIWTVLVAYAQSWTKFLPMHLYQYPNTVTHASESTWVPPSWTGRPPLRPWEIFGRSPYHRLRCVLGIRNF